MLGWRRTSEPFISLIRKWVIRHRNEWLSGISPAVGFHQGISIDNKGWVGRGYSIRILVRTGIIQSQVAEVFLKPNNTKNKDNKEKR